jgi:hypothetical protein
MTSQFEQVKNFLDQSPDKCIDFYPVQNSDGKIANHLGNEFLPYLHVLGRLQNDTLIAVWNDEPFKKDWQVQPIVWIDSEGEPYSVIAANTDEFLTLLTLNTAFIYHQLTGPLQGETTESFISMAKRSFPCYEAFIFFLSNKLGVKMPLDPESIISNAIKNNVSFQKWVDTFHSKKGQ